jgi:N-acetylglucosaminyl-diphospho-decaprenol L-rhamnosyltransferase
MSAAASPELSILIVSYNTRDITLECLESLYRHPPKVPYEVIIVDNASRDGSAEAIAAAYPQANLIASKDNLGFGGGNNLAAEQASGRRLLLLNPDTIVFERTFDAVWEFAEREPQRGIWGGRTLHRDGSLNPPSCWREISLWGLFTTASGLQHAFPNNDLISWEDYGSWPRDTEREVEIVAGCFLLIDTSLWNQLKGFDPSFFMYAEESDLCMRARKLGARPAITPEAALVHLGGASTSSRTEALINVQRARITLMRKHWSRPRFLIGRALLAYWAWSRRHLSKVKAGRFDAGTDPREKWANIWNRRAEWLNGY